MGGKKTRVGSSRKDMGKGKDYGEQGRNMFGCLRAGTRLSHHRCSEGKVYAGDSGKVSEGGNESEGNRQGLRGTQSFPSGVKKAGNVAKETKRGRDGEILYLEWEVERYEGF